MNPRRLLVGVAALLCGIALLIGETLAQDFGGRLTRASPSPSWQQNGPQFVCIADSCGKGSFVALMPGRGNVEARIRSGELDGNWLRQLAASFVQSGQGNITILEAKSHTGSGTPSLTAVYRCNCNNEVKHVALRIAARGESYLTMISMARSPNAARQNLRKIEMAMTGT